MKRATTTRPRSEGEEVEHSLWGGAVTRERERGWLAGATRHALHAESRCQSRALAPTGACARSCPGASAALISQLALAVRWRHIIRAGGGRDETRERPIAVVCVWQAWRAYAQPVWGEVQASAPARVEIRSRGGGVGVRCRSLRATRGGVWLT